MADTARSITAEGLELRHGLQQGARRWVQGQMQQVQRSRFWLKLLTVKLLGALR